MNKSYKYRIYPTRTQETVFIRTIDICRELYNTSVAHRKEVWELRKEPVNYRAQALNLTKSRQNNFFMREVHSQVLQDVLMRVNKAFKAFFRRAEHSEKSGYPRFKGKNRYDSFTYPQSGFKLKNNLLELSKIGSIRIFNHRRAEGEIKTCTIKRDADHWYAIFTVEIENKLPIIPKSAVGVDVGLNSLITLSTGRQIAPPKFLKKSEKKLAKEQKHLSRKKKGSENRQKQRKKVARIHRIIRNQRLDFSHKVARKLVDNFDLIAFEKLGIKNMLQNHYLAKSISDAGWGMLASITNSKAEEAGKLVVFVNPDGTTQECSNCGSNVPKDLSVRLHSCHVCGLVMNRDINAAINILHKAVRTDCAEFTPADTRILVDESGSPLGGGSHKV